MPALVSALPPRMSCAAPGALATSMHMGGTQTLRYVWHESQAAGRVLGLAPASTSLQGACPRVGRSPSWRSAGASGSLAGGAPLSLGEGLAAGRLGAGAPSPAPLSPSSSTPYAAPQPNSSSSSSSSLDAAGVVLVVAVVAVVG